MAISANGGGADCTIPCAVTFSATLKLDHPFTPTSYQWDFGDSETSLEYASTEISPVHLYIKAATYPVNLTVTDGVYSYTLSKQVVVNNGIQWERTLGGTENDRLTAMIQTSDGGYLVGGFSGSDVSADKTENTRGHEDYWLVKLNAKGQKLWDRTYGGKTSDGLLSIVPMADGGYLLAGNSFSDVSGDRTIRGTWIKEGGIASDCWLIKIDQHGEKQWEKAISQFRQRIEAVIQANDGGFLVGGYTHNSSEPTKPDNGSYIVSKFDDSGALQWQRIYGGDGYTFFSDILSSPDGGYLIYGSTTSGQVKDKSEASRGKEDFWIVKISSDGSKQWDKTLGGGGSEYAPTMCNTTDGGYLIGGTSNSGKTGDKTERGFVWENYYEYIRADFWVVKLNALGQKQWDRTYGGSDVDNLRAIVVTNDKNYLVGGTSKSYASYNKSAPKSNSKGLDSDYWFLKINQSGEILWDRAIGGGDDDDLSTMLITAQGNIVLAGSSNSDIGFDKSTSSRGKSDFWIINLKR